MAEKNDTRRLIVEAVITCIEKYGIDKVTTRKIAVEAGTNIASINYYFRSKDELVNEALSLTINHMMEDVFLAIDDTQQPFDIVLHSVIYYFLSGSQKFPGVSRAHLYKAIVERDQQSISAQAMSRVYDRMAQRAVREYSSKDPKHVRFVISEIMSAILFSMLAPGFFPVPREYQLTGPKNARMLADGYVHLFKAMLT